MGAVRPLAKSAVSGSFPRKLTAKDLATPENTGFPGHSLIPVSFVFRGQYDAVWGLHPVEKARRRRTQAAELGYPDDIHGCRQDACPAILPAENQEKGNAKLPQCRRHALTMTKREAETCQVPWTFFLPYRPNGCADSMAIPV